MLLLVALLGLAVFTAMRSLTILARPRILTAEIDMVLSIGLSFGGAWLLDITGRRMVIIAFGGVAVAAVWHGLVDWLYSAPDRPRKR